MERSVQVSAEIKKCIDNELIIEVKIPIIRSMLNGEEVIQQSLNAAGILASQELLKSFDTDGSPIEVAGIRLTSKGKVLKEYETPYGKAAIERHVYQTAKGGATYCPLDNEARVIGSSTPKLAKMISHKYSRNSVDEVKTDLEDNHGRKISKSHIQDIAETVGAIVIMKEENWSYSVPLLDQSISTVSIGMDGAMMLIRNDGYRQAMTGSITLYNKEGERQYSLYVGAVPEYGKEKFLAKMEKEIDHIKNLYPTAEYVGIADGAKDNWNFLEKKTSVQITDFYHATEYLASVSDAIFNKKQEKERIEWLETRCHDLKHNDGAVTKQLKEFKKIKKEQRLSDIQEEKLDTAITYFTNQRTRMDYAKFRSKNLPIGSGVTEAACKTIIKQRFCRSGMKWKNKGAAIVLSLRCLDKSDRWNQFWNKINQYGVPIIA